MTNDVDAAPLPFRGPSVPGRGSFDRERAEAAVRELLYAIGEDPDREGLRDTPARVARAYAEIFAGLYVDPDSVLDKTFDEQHQELGWSSVSVSDGRVGGPFVG